MIKNLIEVEKQALTLFNEAVNRGLIVPGITEQQLNQEIYDLAFDLFGIKKYWHKRIVRAGKNTLLPYKHNPENLTLQTDDILFLDFGPVFEDFEADIGRTFVLGNNERKLKLKNDVEEAFYLGKDFFNKNYLTLTGADFYNYTKELATKFGWEYGNEHCGHLVGKFPHEKIVGEERINYFHPENTELVSKTDKNGNPRYWIYEIHFIDKDNNVGGFFEQLVSTI
jgi:Xaa-Pro dipeptidase